MNQLIKSCLCTIFFLGSTHLFSWTYYYRGGSNLTGSTTSNWGRNKTGPKGTAPIDFKQTGDIFDLNGVSIDMANMDLGAVKIQNSGGAVNPTNSGTVTVSSSQAPFFDLTTINFSSFGSSGTVLFNFTSTTDTQNIPICDYYNIHISGSKKTFISYGLTQRTIIAGELKDLSSTGLEISFKIPFELKSSFVFTTSTGGTTKFYIDSIFSVLDNRITKSFPSYWYFDYNNCRMSSGVYENAIIQSNTNLIGNVTISNILDLNSSSGYSLNIPTSVTLELKGTISGTNSKIAFDGGNIKFNKSNGTYNLPISLTNFCTDITLSNNEIVNLGNDIYILGNINLNNGTLNLNGKNLSVYYDCDGLTDYYNITSTSGKIDATSLNSTFTLELDNYGTAIYTNYNLNTTHFKNAEIYNLKLAFYVGSTIKINGNLTISNSLDLGPTNTLVNNFNINGQTLTINGSITNNGSTGGKFVGGSTSSLVCGATGTLYFQQSGTDNYLKNFTVNNSKIVILGNTLNISGGSSGNYGTVIVDTLATCSTGNNLVLKSTSGGTARIGKSSGTIAQEYTVEQYIKAERDYRFIASPVVGGTALELRDNAPATPTSGRGIHITGSGGSSNSFDNTLTNKPSAFWFDESKAGDITTIGTTSTATDDPGYTAFTSGGSSYTLTNGLGYRIFVRGDRTIDLSASPAPTANTTTIWVKGEYPGYSCTLTVTNSNRAKTNNGINFLGNPYPSAIDWNLVTRSNVNDGYMVYDYKNNAFVGYNGSTGDAGQYISSGQSFFVYCNSSSGGNLKIHERCKADEIGGSFFQQKITNHLKVNLMYDSSYNSNTHIHFLEGMSNHFDQADIPQMVNNGTNIATLDSARFPYYINTLGALDSFESIPLSVQGTPAAKLKLSFFDIASFYNHKIQLVDTYNKTTTDIVEGLIYPFEITSDSMSYKNGRFYLNFSKSELMSNAIITSSLIAKISPNPIQNNEIHITLDKKYQDAQFRITNVTGQIITEGKINNDKIIDAKALAKGVYFVGITSNGTSQTIQIIK